MNATRAASRPALIGANAQLWSSQGGYRSAGISTYIHGLLRHLPAADEGLRYRVYTRERAGLLAMARSAPRLDTANPLARIVWEQSALAYLARRDGLDLLHGLAYALPLASPVPGVVTVYDLSFIEFPSAARRFNRVYLSAITRWSARRAAHVCAISESGRQALIRRLGLPGERVSVVYPGIDERFRPPPSAALAAFRRRKGLPERFVLYLGTLEPRKNLPALVRAYGLLARAGGAPPLLIAGAKGWRYDEIFREVERLDLGGLVRFPGYVPAEEHALWYAAAEVFVYPSRYEGFGLPVAEAMACGTPVLASAATSLPEVVGPDGALAPPDDEEALAEALRGLLDDPARRAALAEAGLRQSSRFTWGRAAAEQAAVYRRALGPGA
ncbi:MAG TPA: glycosyltransferase family 1 protein, partial [Herpetosiphonaceae bacterium]